MCGAEGTVAHAATMSHDCASHSTAAAATAEKEAVICWICHQSTNTEGNPMCQFCACPPSSNMAHYKCLERWVFRYHHTRCDLCKCAYKVSVTEIPGMPSTKTRMSQMFVIVRYFLLPLLRDACVAHFFFSLHVLVIAALVGMAYVRDGRFRGAMPTLFDHGFLAEVYNWDLMHVMVVGWLHQLAVYYVYWEWTRISGFIQANYHDGQLAHTAAETALHRAGQSLGHPSDDAQYSDADEEEGDEEDDDDDDDDPGETPVMLRCLDAFAEMRSIVCLSRRGWVGYVVGLLAMFCLSNLMRSHAGRIALVLLFAVAALLWRRRWPPMRYSSRPDHARLAHAMLRHATSAVQLRIFVQHIVYTPTMFLLMPFMVGMLVQFAFVPSFITFEAACQSWTQPLSAMQVVKYWLLGVLSSFIDRVIDLSVVGAIFADDVTIFPYTVVRIDLNQGFLRHVIEYHATADLMSYASVFLKEVLCNAFISGMAFCLLQRTAFALHGWLFSVEPPATPLNLGFLAPAPAAFRGGSVAAKAGALNAWLQLQQLDVWIEALPALFAGSSGTQPRSLATVDVRGCDGGSGFVASASRTTKPGRPRALLARLAGLAYSATVTAGPRNSGLLCALLGLIAPEPGGLDVPLAHALSTAADDGRLVCRDMVIEAARWVRWDDTIASLFRHAAVDVAHMGWYDVRRVLLRARARLAPPMRDTVTGMPDAPPAGLPATPPSALQQPPQPKSVVRYDDPTGCAALATLTVARPFYIFRTVAAWLAGSLVRHTALVNTLYNFAMLLCILADIAYFFTSLHRPLIRALLPFVRWQARHLVRLEDVLFDPEQDLRLKNYLEISSLDLSYITQPREMAAADGAARAAVLSVGQRAWQERRYRLLIFSAVFLTTLAVVALTIPVLIMSVLLLFIRHTVPLMAVTLSLTFAVIDGPVFTDMLFSSGTMLFLLLFIPLVALRSLLEMVLQVSVAKLAAAVVEYRFGVTSRLLPISVAGR